MKKLLLLLILIIGLSAQAQNLIGLSFRDVKIEMSKKGYVISDGYDSDNDYYLSASSLTGYRVYYFTKDNICKTYVYIIKNDTFNDYEQGLYIIGYRKISDYTYYNGEYIAKIDYNTQLNCWYVSVF